MSSKIYKLKYKFPTNEEIANFTLKERETYERNLKYYRDYNNVIDTAYEEGRELARKEVAKYLKDNDESIEKIMKYTKLSREIIEKL